LKQHDKTVKNIILEIEKEYNLKLTANIIQKSILKEQTNLDAFDIQKNKCMIYLIILLNQSQKITVTKKQANIHSHLKIIRDIINK